MHFAGTLSTGREGSALAPGTKSERFPRLPESPGKNRFLRTIAGGITGFTLIELLVAIVVLGILVALLVPGISSAMQSATRTKCVGRLRNIGVGIMSFAQDNNNCLPTNGSENPFDPAHGYGRYFYLLGPYLFPNLAGNSVALRAQALFRCPIFDSKPDATSNQSYIYNGNLLLMESDGAGSINNTLPTPVRTSSVLRPNTTPILWDISGTTGSSTQYDLPNTKVLQYGYVGSTSDNGLSPNHGRTCTILYVSGRVETANITSFSNSPWYNVTPATWYGKGCMFDPAYPGH